MKKLNMLTFKKNSVNQNDILQKNEMKQILGGYSYGVACWIRSSYTDQFHGILKCPHSVDQCDSECNYDTGNGAYCICMSGYFGI